MVTNADTVFIDLQKIRKQKPLVHNITNYVVMSNTANALLSLGASPIMAHAVEEVHDIVNISSALAVNIGTLSSHWIKAMKIAMKSAFDKGIPIVFDPVGVGASTFRTQTCIDLLRSVKPTIIRGNPSEIIVLSNVLQTIITDYNNLSNTDTQVSKGVDSTESSYTALDAAKLLSQMLDCIVSVSGDIDFVVYNDSIEKIANGHIMMPLVTGLGCTATSLTAAFAAVNKSSFQAAVNAMIIMGIAGEIAASEALGPGTLQVEFIDALYSLDKEQIEARIKISSNPIGI